MAIRLTFDRLTQTVVFGRESLEPTKLTSKDIWQKTLDTLRASWRQTMGLVIVGVLVPDVLLSFYLDLRGSQAATEFRTLVESTNAPGILELIKPIQSFAPEFLFGFLAMVIVASGAYLAVVELALGTLRGMEPTTMPKLLGRGVKTALLRLPGSFLAFFFIAIMAQVLIAPAILLAVLCLLAPVISVSERKGALRSAYEAVTVRYAQGTKYGRWSIMFNLLSVGATFYLVFVVVALGAEQLFLLDQRLPALRGIWDMTFSGHAFGPVYVVTSLVETLLLAFLVTVGPFVTSSIYFLVAGPRELGRV